MKFIRGSYRLFGFLFLAIFTTAIVAEELPTTPFDIIELRNHELAANLYMPKMQADAPVVIVLGGSSGGMRTQYGEYLAQNGIAALTLAYFRFGSLPETLDNIPVEYVHKAIDYLQTVEGINGDKIGLWGASRGAELAFLSATTDSRVKSVAVTTPSKVAWHGARGLHAWTYKGKGVSSLSFERQSSKPIFTRVEQALKYKEKVKAAQFSFEKVNGPILLISAKNDQIWPSFQMSEDIEGYLKKRSFDHTVTHLTYPTGHTFDQRYRPKVRASILKHFKNSL